MGENFVEQLEESDKSLETRAEYTRRFLGQKKISDEDFVAKSKDIGVTVSEEDMKDDKKLVTKVYEIQKAVGLQETDSKEGTDGMFGPYTLGKLEEFIKSGAKRKVVAEDVFGTAKAEPPVADEPKVENGSSAPKAEPVAPKPAAPIQQNEGSNVPARIDPNSNQSETPQANIDKIIKTFPGKSEVVRLAGNGGRQVVIYIPQGFDPSQPTEIDYHFHGMHGNWIDVPFPKLDGTGKYYHYGKIGLGANRITQALSASQKHRNMILVYPLSAGQRSTVGSTAWKNGYDSEWMKKDNSTNDDIALLHRETLSQLSTMLGQEINSPSVTLSGHSAGGIAVRNAVASGFSPDKVKFLDASYGNWASSAYKKVKNNGKTKFEVYVKKGTQTDSADVHSIKDQAGVQYFASAVSHGEHISAYL